MDDYLPQKNGIILQDVQGWTRCNSMIHNKSFIFTIRFCSQVQQLLRDVPSSFFHIHYGPNIVHNSVALSMIGVILCLEYGLKPLREIIDLVDLWGQQKLMIGWARSHRSKHGPKHHQSTNQGFYSYLYYNLI